MRAVLILMMSMVAMPANALITREMVDPGYGETQLARADLDAGPLAPDPPLQSELEETFAVPWRDFEITATHGIGVEAIVLSRRIYREGDLGALVPLDLALAWGKVSDPRWIRHLKVSQGERLYRWSFPRGTRLDARTVAIGSANMHIMPANDDVRASLQDVREGDLVRLSGYLVNISGPDGFTWESSLVRDDTGYGSCELILLENVEIVRGE